MGTVLTQHIDTPEGRALWRELLTCQPGLEAVLNYVRNSQCASAGDRLLWYQRELLDRWFFRIPSPLTGSMIHSGDSLAFANGTTCFRFPDAPGLLLVSGGREDGFPINALLLAMPALCLNFGSRRNALSAPQAALILEKSEAKAFQPPRSASSVTALMLGSASFATRSPEWTALQATSHSQHGRGPVSLAFVQESGSTPCDEIRFPGDWPVKQGVKAEAENRPGCACFWLGCRSSHEDKETLHEEPASF